MLSEHFSLREFTVSATAEKYHINNMPDAQALENMRVLCREVLEPLRHRFGPIYINSGYRCELLNNLKRHPGENRRMARRRYQV